MLIVKEQYSLGVELTSYCNQGCSYCYNAFDHDVQESLPEASLVSLLGRALDEIPLARVSLTGGEPFSHRNLYTALALCAEKGITTHIICNGTMINEENARRLTKYPNLKSVQVTINSPSEEVHDTQVGLPGAWRRAVRGVEMLRKNDIEVTGCIVITRCTVSLVGATLAMMYGLGIRFVALSRLMAAGVSATHLELLPTRGDLLEALGQAECRPFKDMGVRASGPLPPCMIDHDAFPSLTWGWCPIGTPFQDFALGSDGLLRNCLFFETKIGDPRKYSFMELIRSAQADGYRRRTPAFCQGCIELPRCLGGCGASAMAVNGEANSLDPLVRQHIDPDFAAVVRDSRSASSK